MHSQKISNKSAKRANVRNITTKSTKNNIKKSLPKTTLKSISKKSQLSSAQQYNTQSPLTQQTSFINTLTTPLARDSDTPIKVSKLNFTSITTKNKSPNTPFTITTTTITPLSQSNPLTTTIHTSNSFTKSIINTNSIVNTTSIRPITLKTTTTVTNTSQSINTTKPKLIVPTTRPFSSNSNDDDHHDHDHGAYERKPPSDPSQAMKITIVDRNEVEHVVDCKVGDNILQLMRIQQERDPKLYLEGACESSLACSTCHVILDDNSFNALAKIKEVAEEEDDLLDMASCLSPTSRLGCQVNLIKEMDGGKITLPRFSRNFYVDGHVPQPH